MTALRGSQSPNTVAVRHRVVVSVGDGALPKQPQPQHARFSTEAPPFLAIPSAWEEAEEKDMKKGDNRHNKRGGGGVSKYKGTRPLGNTLVLVTFLLLISGCTIFLLQWILQIPNGRNGWNDMRDGGGFRENEVFLTAADYAVILGSGKPHGAACFTAADCMSGSICAFPAVHNNSVRICCADAVALQDLTKFEKSSSSSSSAIAENLNNNNKQDQMWLNVCTGAALGEPCGSQDKVCASGHCIFGKCVAAPLPGLTHCQKDSDCASGACAFYGHDLRDDPRCCPGHEDDTNSNNNNAGAANHNNNVLVLKPPSLPYEISYCANVPLGTACGEMNEMCASGWCSHGVCRDPSTRRRTPADTQR